METVIAPPPRILNLEDIRDESLRDQVGGKAAGLARLIAAGLRVPAGFVIVDAVAGAFPPDLADHYRHVGGGAVAVRSSALGEDGADASFAGQYETVLDVVGEEALRAAIDACVASLSNARALAYQREQAGGDGRPARMCVVVQQMVPARAAGVLFTADPVSGRRAHVVIDAVPGLGEALVSGHASPDHLLVGRGGDLLEAQLAGARAVLDDAERRRLVEEALVAESKLGGEPLDMEWAIDASGLVHWLQARPVTTLGSDLHELDTPLFDAQHVYTRCNVGEMFPGACTPLSFSFTARSIDRGMQMMQQAIGLVPALSPHMRFIGMHSGHLFLNLSTMAETSSGALGSSTDDLALSVCGRPLDEMRLQAPPPPGLPRRILNGVRYARYLFSRGRARRDIVRLAKSLQFPDRPTAAELWRAIDARIDANDLAMHHHLISSASSGILTPTLIGVLAAGEPPNEAHQAEAAARLAGADGVESADIVKGAERIEDAILLEPDADARFIDAEPEAALDWLRSPESAGAQRAFVAYLQRHGHRAIKELELRQPEWRHDPMPLVRSIQIALRGLRASGGQRPDRPAVARHDADGMLLRWLTRLAREAVRSREETKSGLVAVAAAFKVAYRNLAKKMVAEGLLADEDAVFFLTHEELGARIAGDERLAARALARREVHEAQSRLRFPDVFVGLPQPLRPEAAHGQGQVTGAPVSRGRVVGRVRIVRNLEEAEALQPGEILVAPITDVGWTPYFSLIAGLVTDVGSAVSHGAVVAREYGLPAVVNTRFGTDVFETGDRVELDGDHGIVRKLEDDECEALDEAAREAARV